MQPERFVSRRKCRSDKGLRVITGVGRSYSKRKPCHRCRLWQGDRTLVENYNGKECEQDVGVS